MISNQKSIKVIGKTLMTGGVALSMLLANTSIIFIIVGILLLAVGTSIQY